MKRQKPRIDLPYDFAQGGQDPSAIITPDGRFIDQFVDVDVPAVRGAQNVQGIKIESNSGTIIIINNGRGRR